VLTGLPKLIALLRQTDGGLSDDRLLARFVAHRDEDAFAALVRRHGAMVWCLCRRVLGHHQDAEDAFQAAFLVLAQKAAAVRPGAALGPWLYGVAHKVALKAAATVRRRSRERQVEDMPHPAVGPAGVPDWRPLLDRELGRLSERYRAAVVLCDLEGHSRKAASLRLGIPERTLASRLTRAHALLARRLRGRGVALPVAALAVALAADATAFQVPESLARSTARVAALVAAGNLAGAEAAPVLLMKGVMRAMLMRKLKVVVVALVATSVFGVIGLASRTGEEVRAQDTSAPATRTSSKPASELETLRRENEDLRATVRVLLKEIQVLQRGSDAGPRKTDTGKGLGDRVQYGSVEYNLPKKETVADPGARGSDRYGYGTSYVPSGAKKPSSDSPSQSDKHPVPEHSSKTPPRSGDKDRGGSERSSDPNLIGAAREVEDALQALRRAGDPESRRRAAEALDRATRRLRDRYAPTTPKE
jgi:RNA polymerase sigma factor (sigma-70 family)